ncbi:MAG: hypothetical protein D6718_05745 [Acidobacteria bacterium]|nr:MAG: hypothetical protein D6718_05745 [Acidobacteriota bacterium]
MSVRSRAVLFGALSLLVVAVLPAWAAPPPPEDPYIVEPAEGLPMWYWARYAVFDYHHHRSPGSRPDIPIEIDPLTPHAATAASGRGSGVGTGPLAGTAGIQASVAFPATMGRMPSRPAGLVLRQSLVDVRRALGL